MSTKKVNDSISQRIQAMNKRVEFAQKSDLYFYNQPISELQGKAKVIVNGREMTMFASYSYLGLIGHPKINSAAKNAIDKYGTGTHGVRTLAGSLSIHQELEELIAQFKHTEAAITYSSGYVTNLSVVSTLLGRGDYVISDKLNHASIVDGCLMSGAKFLRFQHNDMVALEERLQQVPKDVACLVITDSVFSMETS
jgi:7-keto-8-aminopelargonate synthetase-like enzyme